MSASRDDDAQVDLNEEDYAYLLSTLLGEAGPSDDQEQEKREDLRTPDEEKILSALKDVSADVYRTGRPVTRSAAIAAAARHRLSAIETAMLELRAEEAGHLSSGVLDDADRDETEEFQPRRMQEVVFSRAINAGEAAAAALERGQACHDVALTRRLESLVAEGQRAKASFVRANLGLVRSMADGFVGQGLDFLDLVQEGTLGLLTAVERFDWTLGYTFSTYATWWVRQAIERAIANQGRAIRIPVHKVEKIKQLKREIRRMAFTLRREPTLDEIARATGLDPADVEYLRNLDAELISLDSPVRDEADSATIGDTVPSRDDPIEEEVERRLLAEVLDEALDKLKPREREIMVRRFGLDDGVPDTLEEIGQDFGVTRERIRQIESKSLEKLRRLRVFAGWFEEEKT